jgi:hypothetical protein
MNYARIALGGVVAGVVCFIGDGIVHGVLLKSGWTAIAANLHLPQGGTGGFEYFSLYDLAKGILSVLLYAMIRPRFGKGPRTAVIAGLLTWALALPVPLFGMLPIHFFGRKFALLWSIYGAFPIVIGAVAGCFFYREEEAAQPAVSS